MIRLIIGLFKLALIIVVVLIIGQIPVGDKRISDHMRSFTQLPAIQAPIHWIADKFDPSGRSHNHKTLRASRVDHETGPEHSESDRNLLSGLLKRSHH